MLGNDSDGCGFEQTLICNKLAQIQLTSSSLLHKQTLTLFFSVTSLELDLEEHCLQKDMSIKSTNI